MTEVLRIGCGAGLGNDRFDASVELTENSNLVSRVVSDFTAGVRDNGVCLLLRRLCCVPVMSRD